MAKQSNNQTVAQTGAAEPAPAAEPKHEPRGPRPAGAATPVIDMSDHGKKPAKAGKLKYSILEHFDGEKPSLAAKFNSWDSAVAYAATLAERGDCDAVLVK